MNRVLVTGGAGFIGSHIVKRLVNRGVTVRVLDNFSSGRASSIVGQDCVEVIEGDIRCMETCQSACDGIDTVFHLAALVSVPQSVADPVLSDSINSGGMLNLLVAARDKGVRRLVFSSSSAIYGDTLTIPTPETVLPRPTSPYGVQKLSGEHYARNFALLFGLQTVCLRYFNVYGPGQDPSSPYAAAIPKFLVRLLRGEAPCVFGDGEQTRDFCFVEDVASANICAATTEDSGAFGAVFNIGSGNRITLNELLPRLQQCVGVSLPISYQEERAGDIKHSGADISAARALLGYEPQYTLDEGLVATAMYYREHR